MILDSLPSSSPSIPNPAPNLKRHFDGLHTFPDSPRPLKSLRMGGSWDANPGSPSQDADPANVKLVGEESIAPSMPPILSDTKPFSHSLPVVRSSSLTPKKPSSLSQNGPPIILTSKPEPSSYQQIPSRSSASHVKDEPGSSVSRVDIDFFGSYSSNKTLISSRKEPVKASKNSYQLVYEISGDLSAQFPPEMVAEAHQYMRENNIPIPGKRY